MFSGKSPWNSIELGKILIQGKNHCLLYLNWVLFMKYAIFLDICKFSHVASTKEDKSNEGEPMDGNLKQNNVVRGL